VARAARCSVSAPLITLSGVTLAASAASTTLLINAAALALGSIINSALESPGIPTRVTPVGEMQATEATYSPRPRSTSLVPYQALQQAQLSPRYSHSSRCPTSTVLRRAPPARRAGGGTRAAIRVDRALTVTVTSMTVTRRAPPAAIRVEPAGGGTPIVTVTLMTVMRRAPPAASLTVDPAGGGTRVTSMTVQLRGAPPAASLTVELAGGDTRAAIRVDRALAAQSLVPLRSVSAELAGSSSLLAGSPSRPRDSRMTRTRGGGEPEEDGVSRAGPALHSSVRVDRRTSPALSATRVREAQGSASVPPLSPSHALGRHGYMGTEERRSEAASRPLSTHDVTTDSAPHRHSGVPDRRLLSSPALSATRVREAQGSTDSAPAADCVLTNDAPPPTPAVGADVLRDLAAEQVVALAKLSMAGVSLCSACASLIALSGVTLTAAQLHQLLSRSSCFSRFRKLGRHRPLAARREHR
jgi:hypothetical protein